MDVAVVVTARPVASQMTLVKTETLRVAIWTESSFGFQIRDLDGLLIQRAAGNYDAQLVRCEDCEQVETCSSCRSNTTLRVAYAGSGRHDVIVNVQQLVFHGTPRLSILRQPLHERNSSAPSRRARTRDTSRG